MQTQRDNLWKPLSLISPTVAGTSREGLNLSRNPSGKSDGDPSQGTWQPPSLGTGTRQGTVLDWHSGQEGVGQTQWTL